MTETGNPFRNPVWDEWHALVKDPDALDMWKDTVVVLTTDHGHLLGEHGYWGKNGRAAASHPRPVPVPCAA